MVWTRPGARKLSNDGSRGPCPCVRYLALPETRESGLLGATVKARATQTAGVGPRLAIGAGAPAETDVEVRTGRSPLASNALAWASCWNGAR